jgi:hypothetical protein
MEFTKFILFIFSVSLTNISIGQEWTLEKDKNGIKIYARDVADSQFSETKAICNFNTSKEEFLAFIWHIEDYPNWQSDYKISKIIESKNDFDKTIYFEFKAPWPVSNRDVVINMKQVIKDDATYAYTKIAASEIKPIDGIIRMSKYDGFWKIKEIENGIEVTLQMSTNPEGKIPGFLIDFYKTTGPFNAFTNMQNIFE